MPVQLSIFIYKFFLRSCDRLAKQSGACDNFYMILADEYAGNSETKNILGHDNSAFTNALSQRGFHVVENSSSNYISTPFSMASILNMSYLKPHLSFQSGIKDCLLCIGKSQ